MWSKLRSGEHAATGLAHLKEIGLPRIAVDSGADMFMHNLLWAVSTGLLPGASTRELATDLFPGIEYGRGIATAGDVSCEGSADGRAVSGAGRRNLGLLSKSEQIVRANLVDYGGDEF
jgi:hypothetical protein